MFLFLVFFSGPVAILGDHPMTDPHYFEDALFLLLLVPSFCRSDYPPPSFIFFQPSDSILSSRLLGGDCALPIILVVTAFVFFDRSFPIVFPVLVNLPVPR